MYKRLASQLSFAFRKVLADQAISFERGMCVVHEDQSTPHEPSVRNLLPDDRLPEVHRSVGLLQGQPPGHEPEGGEHIPETINSSRDSLLLCGRPE